MFLASATGGLLYAFEQSDSFARIVILLLICLSIYAWSVMIEKWLTIHNVQRQNRRFLTAFASSETVFDMVSYLPKHKGPLPEIYRSGLEQLQSVLHLQERDLFSYGAQFVMPRSLKDYEVDRIRSTCERSVSLKVCKYEDRLAFLGTVVTVSPFLGLLGTVWGVMMAFCGMAQAGQPDITAMAPGVSGALLTTVVGLLVAIPSVVGFNMISNRVKQTITEMDNFVEDFTSLLKLYTAEENPFLVGEE